MSPAQHETYPYRGYEQHERLAVEWAAGWMEEAQRKHGDKDEDR